MKIRTLIAVSIMMVSGILFAPAKSYSQDKGELLPDIDPQDIEIRGQFKARFPGLHRQPILGFNSEMQAYQIDPNRKPYMESGDQVVANLPISNLSRPAPPAFPGLQYTSDITTFAQLGFGSYTSPKAKFWGVYPLDGNSYAGGDLDLSSSDGHLGNRPSSYRFLTAHAEYGAKINAKTEFNIHGGLQNDFNYSARYNETGSTAEIARIEYQGYNLGADLSRFVNDVSGWKLQANIRSFNVDVGKQPPGGSIDELVYNGSFSNRWALGKPTQTFTVKVGGRGGNYDRNEVNNQGWATVQGGVAYESMFNYQTNIHAEADVYYATDINESKVYPGGLLKVDQWIGNRLKITGKVEGKPKVQSVEQLHEQNRFLGYDNNLIHTYTVDVTGEAFIKYYRGSKLHGGVTYRNFTNYAYFLPESLTDNTNTSQLNAYTINYRNATNIKLFAGITHQLLPERFWISAEAYVQHPELNGGDKIPFKESWGVDASASFRPVDFLTIKGWTNYVPKRHTNITNNEKLDGFLLVGAQADVNFTDNFGAYVKLANLLDQNYQQWKGYQERPLQVYGGLTLKF